MKKVKKSAENCHFYSREKSLYIAWACFRNDYENMPMQYAAIFKACKNIVFFLDN